MRKEIINLPHGRKVINYSTLERMHLFDSDENYEFIHDLFQIFAEATETRLTLMENALKNKHYSEVARTAHYINSGAKTLGVERISAICELIEEEFQDQQPTAAAIALIEGLRREFLIAKRVFHGLDK